MLHHLLQWVQNGHTDKYVKETLQHAQPYDSSSYWPAVSMLLKKSQPLNPLTPDSAKYKTDEFWKITNWVKLKNKQHHSKLLLNSFCP